jgi:hypothetical protein
MPWLNHPKFVRVREEILQAVQKHEYRFRRTPNVIFLCGGIGSQPRDRLAEFLRKKHKEDTLLFYAEEVWIAISRYEELSALEMEAKLAALSDIVIIIVESPGTFAELGAFSLSNDLRKKLLPILDEKYRTGKSFVETGPVRWTDKDSDFRPAIWVDHKSILEAAVEIETRLDKILPTPVRVANLAASPKHLLFFICDLVAIFGPCPAAHVAYYVQRLLGGEQRSVPTLLGLATAMGLLKSFGTGGEVELFHRPLAHGNLPVFHYTKKHLGIPTLRAKVLSVMQTLDVATQALRGLKETYAAATDG